MEYFRIKNYEKYQAKKSDRNTLPWIKLHKKIMNDWGYGELRVSERLMFIHMLLMADSVSNRFPLDPKWMRSRLQVDAQWIFANFESKGLIEKIGHEEKTDDSPRREDINLKEINKHKKKEKKTLVRDPGDLGLASAIRSKLIQDNPNFRGGKILGKWADDIRLMRERDGMTLQKIREMFEWANADEFWGGNILSPGKMREKMDQLVAQRSRVNGHGNRRLSPSEERAKAELDSITGWDDDENEV